MAGKKKSVENALRARVINLLRQDPYVSGRVYDQCGSIEFGIDLTFERKDAFGITRLYGVQLKAGDLKSSNIRASRGVKELLGQISIAFGHRFQPHDRFLDGVYVIVSGEVNPHAREYLVSARVGFREVYVLDGNDLTRFFTLAQGRIGAFQET